MKWEEVLFYFFGILRVSLRIELYKFIVQIDVFFRVEFFQGGVSDEYLVFLLNYMRV